MTIGVTPEHEALRSSVRGWADRAGVRRSAREALEAVEEVRPAWWQSCADQGLLALHLPTEYGGAGATAVELAVVVEELARAAAPGPVVSTVLASLLLAETQAATALAKELLPALADGSMAAAVGLAAGSLRVEDVPGGLRLSGTSGPVLSGHLADLLVLPAAGADGLTFLLVDAGDLTVTAVPGLDPSRRVATVDAAGVHVAADRVLAGVDDARVRGLAAVVLAADAAGTAGWCLDTAVAYAKVRQQFGAPIGSFQAVKHLCADMLTQVELARGTAWDAARAAGDAAQGPLAAAAAVAAATALEAAVVCAKGCVQVLGGIGFTWEHDAHLALKRAAAARALLGGPPGWQVRAARSALGGTRRTLDLDLAEATGDSSGVDALRAELRGLAGELAALPVGDRRVRLAAEGLLAPHWPRPWGRGAGAVEQLLVDSELRAAGVDVPDLVIGAWALPTIIGHGSPEQQERFVQPTLLGDLVWCQLFSEPGAGSDLASLSMRARRVEGGWSLTGQKVWTSVAATADWGICLARTDPAAAPRHRGITYFLVDMRSPGLEVRPLRELTGEALFNEVFFTDVVVPDDCVVGAVGGGWRLARTTLANERVAMSRGPSLGAGVEDVLRAVADTPGADDPLLLQRIGGLVCEAQALALLGLRATVRSVAGTDPGATSSVQKLVGMLHRQDVAELALTLLGPAAAASGTEEPAVRAFLSTRALTIAGGTTEILKSVIGERVLGLPRP